MTEERRCAMCGSDFDVDLAPPEGCGLCGGCCDAVTAEDGISPHAPASIIDMYVRSLPSFTGRAT